ARPLSGRPPFARSERGTSACRGRASEVPPLLRVVGPTSPFRAGRWEAMVSSIAAWIDELRRRLDAGELADLPPIDLGNGLVLRDVELAAWIMLADVDRYAAMPPELRRPPVIAARRRLLADNLRRLRERLDGPAAYERDA